METKTTAPTLGATALIAWRAWREVSQEHYPGLSTFGWTAHLGEVFWLGKDLCRYVTYPGFEVVSEALEDKFWKAMCNGMLQVHRRRYAPLIGADERPKVILHAALAEPLPAGTL